MGRIDTLTATGDGLPPGGQHERYDRPKEVRRYEKDRAARPPAGVADGAEAGAGAHPDALDLFLFSFAAGSAWGPAGRWLLMTGGDKAKGPDHRAYL